MPMDRTMDRNRPRTVVTPDHHVVAFNPPSPAGWQFMARELERMAEKIQNGEALNEDHAGALHDIAVLIRQHAKSY